MLVRSAQIIISTSATRPGHHEVGAASSGLNQTRVRVVNGGGAAAGLAPAARACRGPPPAGSCRPRRRWRRRSRRPGPAPRRLAARQRLRRSRAGRPAPPGSVPAGSPARSRRGSSSRAASTMKPLRRHARAPGRGCGRCGRGRATATGRSRSSMSMTAPYSSTMHQRHQHGHGQAARVAQDVQQLLARDGRGSRLMRPPACRKTSCMSRPPVDAPSVRAGVSRAHDAALHHDRDAVAVLGLVHVVRGDEDA